MDVRVCAFRCCRACALSQIVADRAGNIFNKDALIMYTLHKAERTIPAFSHIRSLKQVLAECVWSAREVDALAVRTQGLFCLQRASGVAGVAPVSMHVPRVALGGCPLRIRPAPFLGCAFYGRARPPVVTLPLSFLPLFCG